MVTSSNLLHVCTAYILISKINKYAQPIANTLNRHVTHIEGEPITWQEEPRRPKGTEEHATGLLVGEWSRPFCSWPWVGRLMGPKPVASEDEIGFSPDDRNWTDLVYIHIYIIYNIILIIFKSFGYICHDLLQVNYITVPVNTTLKTHTHTHTQSLLC